MKFSNEFPAFWPTRPNLTSYNQSQAIPAMAVVAESEVGHKAKWRSKQRVVQGCADITQATAMPFPWQCIANLLPSSPTEVTLHMFTDASLCAYGAVAYLQQGTQSAILISKSRTAPLKQHTLPILELMAAVLRTRLYSFIFTFITVNHSVHFWSDNQIILSWIASKKTLKSFVSNCINELWSVSAHWKYTYMPISWQSCQPTDQRNILWSAELIHPMEAWPNMADHIIQVASVATFRNSTHTGRHRWGGVEVLPVATHDSLSAGLHHLIDVTRFSKFTKLLAVTANVCQFIYSTKQWDLQLTGSLTTSEFIQANLKWINNIQHTIFAKEIANIQSYYNLLPLVRQLKLFLDSDITMWREYSQCPSIWISKIFLSTYCHQVTTLPSKCPHKSALQWGKWHIDHLKTKLLDPICLPMVGNGSSLSVSSAIV